MLNYYLQILQRIVLANTSNWTSKTRYIQTQKMTRFSYIIEIEIDNNDYFDRPIFSVIISHSQIETVLTKYWVRIFLLFEFVHDVRKPHKRKSFQYSHNTIKLFKWKDKNVQLPTGWFKPSSPCSTSNPMKISLGISGGFYPSVLRLYGLFTSQFKILVMPRATSISIASIQIRKFS